MTFFSSDISYSVLQLAEILEAEIIGDNSLEVNNIASLKEAQRSSLSFYNNANYLDDLVTTSAGVCLISKKDIDRAQKNQSLSLLVVKDVYWAFATIADLFYKSFEVNFQPFISDRSVISENVSYDKTACYIGDFTTIAPNVKLGNNIYIGNNVYIGEGVIIGDNTVIHNNVTLLYCSIGKGCILHSGVRVGQDGFGFVPGNMETGHKKIQHLGAVVIGNNVEIGANSCVDRGTLGNTEIGDGTKLDNMVQIAHNVKVGKHCFIAALSGLAGSSSIKDFVFIGGQSGIAPHVILESGKQVVPMSGIMSDIPGEKILMGSPAMAKKDYFTLQVILKKLVKNKKLLSSFFKE